MELACCAIELLRNNEKVITASQFKIISSLKSHNADSWQDGSDCESLAPLTNEQRNRHA